MCERRLHREREEDDACHHRRTGTAHRPDYATVLQADPAVLGDLCERYALEMNPASVPDLVERFGVRFPAEPLVR